MLHSFPPETLIPTLVEPVSFYKKLRSSLLTGYLSVSLLLFQLFERTIDQCVGRDLLILYVDPENFPWSYQSIPPVHLCDYTL